MDVSTDTPRITIASFEMKGDKTYLRAETAEKVQLSFEVDVMALALMSLTMTPALQMAKARLDKENPQAQPPAAPDTPEGLEG